ncbi:MAG: DNA mismatch repair endonuclease MutL [Bacillota bacterium]
MKRIVVLDALTINQIAAGEVIERPASVVKEMVENSLDAGSTRVEIAIEGGGATLIRVRDNGHGIPLEDVPLAFASHATSKINVAGDLSAIGTLGFRGEALASIAAVAKVELTSRPADRNEGTRVRIEGGKIISCEPAGCPPGTSVTVTELFYNTPARRKFLRSPSSESAAIHDLLNRLVLGFPEVSFSFWNEGRLVLKTQGNNNFLDTVAAVLGRDTARQLIPLEWEAGPVGIKGLIGQTGLHRSNRQNQTFLVNNRHVRNRALTQALEAAYNTLLPVGRYPVAVIRVYLEPDQVDVNVHPAKMEVRFLQEKLIKETIEDGIRKKLQESGTFPQWTVQRKTNLNRQPVKQLDWTVAVRNILGDEKEQPLYTSEDPETGLDYCGGKGDALPAANLPVQEEPATFSGAGEEAQACTEETGQGSIPELLPLGQLHASYILAQGAEGLYIIDQHAAHERVLYEELSGSQDGALPLAQQLAVPVTLELSPLEHNTLIQNILILRDLGIIVEDFGGHTFLVRSVPVGVNSGSEHSFITDLLEELSDGPLPPGIVKEAIRKMVACKSAVKAHQILSLGEMAHLIGRLRQAELPYTCPHGRPTLIRLTSQQLAREFLRT